MTSRKDELRRFLREYLEGANVAKSSRASWVTDHLVEYVERLAGFALNTDVPVAELAVGDLMDTVTVSLERLADELRDPVRSEEVSRAFARLVNLKDALVASPTHEGVRLLVNCSLELQRLLQASNPK